MKGGNLSLGGHILCSYVTSVWTVLAVKGGNLSLGGHILCSYVTSVWTVLAVKGGNLSLGNDQDVKKLDSFFKQELNFDVQRVPNLELEVLKDCLSALQKELSGAGAETYYCFICAILSHGNENGILTQDKQHISMDTIRGYFDNKHMGSFAGRPRVFLVQACRGAKKQQGIDIADDEPIDISDIIGRTTVPGEADFLIAYSTTEGHKSFRRDSTGSWFMHSLLKVLKERHRTEHLEEMLIDVRAEVSQEWQTCDGTKQMPCTWSTLRKRLYFC
ncbi:hypothetical protein ScPMuIL_005326 [Solemya velum]